MQEPVHQRAVKEPKRALPDDVGMVGQNRRSPDSRSQVQEIAEWPWEVVVDEVGPLGQTVVDGEGLQRHAAGSDFDIAAGAIDRGLVATQNPRLGVWRSARAGDCRCRVTSYRGRSAE